MSNGDPCICGATDTWHPECYQRQQEEATKAAHDEIRKQTRADALREAAGIAASWHDSADCDPCDCLKAVSANILALIDQPQEDVCEHNWQKVSDRDWYQINGEGPLYPGPPGKCPYCGKPIKVKE